MHEATFDFLVHVLLELSAARAKFPSNKDITLAATEEFGEVVKALLDQKQGKSSTSSQIYHECAQAAAMATRIAVEGDPNFPSYIPPGIKNG